ncbi:MAG: Holliday junction branch migration protein RuvA [Porphyromonas sp.]|nr:Holliday junction branch migration protein RuvA [Porphyromonas sp.]
MIAHLRGSLSELSPTSVVVDCAGVGYLVNISLNTYSYLSNQRGEVKLLTTQIIREDAHLLYGFATNAERELFGHLISVSGIGPNTARIILSQYSPAELNSILALGQVDALKAVKGIGLKTAQRIVLELKGKLELRDDAEGGAATLGVQIAGAKVQEEAVAALRMLGYPDAAAQKAVRQLLGASPAATVEQLIKDALKML